MRDGICAAPSDPAFTTGPHNKVWDDYSYDPYIPEAVFWMARTKGAEDALGVCIYTTSYLAAYAVENEDLAEQLSAAMGVEITADELQWRGQRSYNLEKMFNTLHTRVRTERQLSAAKVFR